MNRVYILGAGASKFDTRNEEFPLPLATEFFAPLYWDMLSSVTSDSDIVRVLTDYFGFNPTTNPQRGKAPNIESVFSLLEEGVNALKFSSRVDRALERAREQLMQYVFGVLEYGEDRYSDTKLADHKLAKTIVATLDNSDSIITFNWDLLLDNHLKTTDAGRSLLEQQTVLLDPRSTYDRTNLNFLWYTSQLDEVGYFIKLHGSLNFVYCLNQHCPNHLYPVRVGEGVSEVFYDRYCWECASELRVLIAQPTNSKSFAGHRFLKIQANQAIEKVRFANEIVIIGYSFPAFDFNTQSLFRLAGGWRIASSIRAYHRLDKLVIVDPRVRDYAFVTHVLESLRAEKLMAKVQLYETCDEYIEAAT